MKVCVLGAGKSGIAAALLAKRKGFDVFLSEFSEKPNPNFAILGREKIEFEYGQHNESKILDADLIIPSPGIPPNVPILKKAQEQEIQIQDETGFALRFLSNKIIAVTGTNGKTTTVNIIKHIFDEAARKSILGGNVGNPLSNYVDKVSNDTTLILELSSYQLERMGDFSPEVSVFLNISEDHLDWHGSFVNYFNSKWKITTGQKKDNLLVLTLDDKNLTDLAFSVGTKTKAQISAISKNLNQKHGDKFQLGVLAENGKIFFFKQQGADPLYKEELMPTRELALPGEHNLYNSMAAAIAARRFEIPNEDIRDALSSFKGVEHRMEFVRNLHDIDYINDSKSTNLNSAWFALTSYNRPIVWIAGGKDSSNDYSELDEVVKSNVKKIISFGEDAANIFNHFSGFCSCEQVYSLKEALVTAVDSAIGNDVILFSPACKSFDQYTNFEERGSEFKQIVNSL